jgi:hypothetical protein
MNADTRTKILGFLRKNAILLFYILQILFILIYSEPEVQPFVYVRF